jgi:transcriptional regulator with XRE-family HTH domain
MDGFLFFLLDIAIEDFRYIDSTSHITPPFVLMSNMHTPACVVNTFFSYFFIQSSQVGLYVAIYIPKQKEIMKITKNLLEWLQSEFNKRGLTYAELGRRGGTNYQNFQRMLQGISQEIQQDMVDATCAAFNVSELQLIQISKTGSPNIEQRIKEDQATYKTANTLEIDSDANEILIRRAAEHGMTPEDYLSELLKNVDKIKNL